MSAPAHIARENGKKGGRPKAAHTIQAEKAKQLLIAMYIANAKPINDKLLEMARGGDLGAIRELHERAWGKSAQSLDLSNKDGTLAKADPESLKLAQEFEKKLKTKSA